MVATLAWTRLDLTMPGWAFFGGTKLVWTATIGEKEDVWWTDIVVISLNYTTYSNNK